MQLLQFSGLLEAQACKLHRDALRLQTAALCGTATTNFLDIMESFFGVEEDEAEANLEDAASMAAFIKANKEERAKDIRSKDLSVTKGAVELEEVGIEGEGAEETDSIISGSQPSKAQTCPKRTQAKKYPTICQLNEAQLVYPASASTLHDTGEDPKYIGSRENLAAYKGLYCCLFRNCNYGAQVRGNTLSHICRVHLGVAFGCRFCPGSAWWQARSWSNHMDSVHPLQPKYEDMVLKLPGPLIQVKGEPEVFVEEEHIIIPAPGTKTVDPTDTDEPNTKRIKKEVSKMMTYKEWEQASKEGEVYLLADSSNPNQPHPQVAAIRYHQKPSGGDIAKFTATIVTSTSEEKPAEAPKSKENDDELPDDPDYIPDFQEGEESDNFDDDELLCDEDVKEEAD